MNISSPQSDIPTFYVKSGQALSKVTSTGAMTYSFIQAIERGQGTTYGSILNAMRSTIQTTGNDLGGGIVTSLLTMLLTGGSLGIGMRQVFFIQTLSCNQARRKCCL